MFVLSLLEAPNTKTNSLCVQTHLAIKLFLILILILNDSDKAAFSLENEKDGLLLLLLLLQTRSFLLHKTLFNGLETCGLLVNYCDVFISCLDSHSDGTHSLQRIHF